MGISTSTDGLCDVLGTVFEPDRNARIVCLVPSITELLCALGLASRLVGRTGFCIHPDAQVRAIPKVGGTKDVNIEKIRRLSPTHLIVNIDENEKPTVDLLREVVPHIVVTHPEAPRDNLSLYRFLGRLFGAQARADKLCADFEAAYAPLVARRWPRRSVLYLIWKDPWMTVAPHTYIGNLLGLVGWQQVALGTPERYPRIELEQAASEVELVLLSSEPYRFTTTERDDLERILSGPRVLSVDGEMLSWYGSRAIAGLRYLYRLAETQCDQST